MATLKITNEELNQIILEEVKSLIAEEQESFLAFLDPLFDATEGYDYALAFAGTVPFFGDIADIYLALKEFRKGDYISAFISFLAALPGLGSAFRGLQVAIDSRNAGALFSGMKAVNAARTEIIRQSKGVEAIFDLAEKELKELGKGPAGGALKRAIENLGVAEIERVKDAAREMNFVTRAAYGSLVQKVLPILDVFAQMVMTADQFEDIGTGEFTELYDSLNDDIGKILGEVGGVAGRFARAVRTGGKKPEIIQSTGFDDLAARLGMSMEDLAAKMGIETQQQFDKFMDKAYSEELGGFKKEELEARGIKIKGDN